MRLYWNAYSRATRPRWLIEEAGIPCEIVNVDMRAGEHKTDAYRAVHPHGKVPALVDGDTTIIESAAITLYLADNTALAPAPGTTARGLYYQWAFWSMVTLEPQVVVLAAQARKPPEEQDKAALAEATERYQECLRVLTPVVASHTWVLGDTFSAADVLLVSILAWAGAMKLNAGFPEIEAYVARGKARPGFDRARK